MLQTYLLMIDNEEDKSKFESIYLKYKNLMLNRAFDILNDPGLAEDAVHNAFLSILKNLSKISDLEAKETRGYVIVIVENAAKKIYNKEHKIITTEFHGSEAEISAEEEYINQISVEMVKRNIESLSEIYKRVMILKYFNDLDDREIADTLSIPIATVRKRVLRGKKLLLVSIKDGE